MAGVTGRLQRYVDYINNIQKIEDIEIKLEILDLSKSLYSSPTNGGNFGIGLSISKILCEKLGVLYI